jgi:hypothetical protein
MIRALILALVCGCAHKPTGNPSWLGALIAKGEAVAVERATYKGKTVYYVAAPCCDRLNYVYDADGKKLGSPDGGFSGRGDGRLDDFQDTVQDRTLIWRAK